jgi:hypothetical protein
MTGLYRRQLFGGHLSLGDRARLGGGRPQFGLQLVHCFGRMVRPMVKLPGTAPHTLSSPLVFGPGFPLPRVVHMLRPTFRWSLFSAQPEGVLVSLHKLVLGFSLFHPVLPVPASLPCTHRLGLGGTGTRASYREVSVRQVLYYPTRHYGLAVPPSSDIAHQRVVNDSGLPSLQGRRAAPGVIPQFRYRVTPQTSTRPACVITPGVVLSLPSTFLEKGICGWVLLDPGEWERGAIWCLASFFGRSVPFSGPGAYARPIGPVKRFPLSVNSFYPPGLIHRDIHTVN